MENLELKAEIVRRCGTAIAACTELEMSKSKLSLIVRGHQAPSQKDREAFERLLGADVVKRVFKQQPKSVDQPAAKASGVIGDR